MNGPVRQELLSILKEISEHTTSVRFGQLIANLSYLALGPTNQAIWDVEDSELLAAARKHLSELCERETSAA
jgi:hypothetical protein